MLDFRGDNQLKEIGYEAFKDAQITALTFDGIPNMIRMGHQAFYSAPLTYLKGAKKP